MSAEDGDLRTAIRLFRRGATGFVVGDFTIHVRGANDPDAVEPVSYVVEHEAGTFFHGGDSKPAESFHDVGSAFDLDCGALAFGTTGLIAHPDEDAVRRTTWYMDENQVVGAANALGLSRLLPSHYDMWRGMVGDLKALSDHAASFSYPRRIEPVRIGDRVDLGEPGIVPPRTLR